MFEDLYQALHSRAKALLRSKHKLDPTGPTSLVHDAFLRLERAEGLRFVDEQHFIAVASRVMRRLVIDRARAMRSEAHGGHLQVVELDAAPEIGLNRDPHELLAIDGALERVRQQHERAARVGELMIFGGLNVAEVAALLAITRRTIHRDIEILRGEMQGLGHGPEV